MYISDISKLNLKFGSDLYHVDDQYLIPDGEIKYSFLTDGDLGMKPVGRVYYSQAASTHYKDGAPFEMPTIGGGEMGVIQRYLRAGVPVFTREQVISILTSRCYERGNQLKPKITGELAEFLEQIANSTAKDKPKRAKELLKKYPVIGGTGNEENTKLSR